MLEGKMLFIRNSLRLGIDTGHRILLSQAPFEATVQLLHQPKFRPELGVLLAQEIAKAGGVFCPRLDVDSARIVCSSQFQYILVLAAWWNISI